MQNQKQSNVLSSHFPKINAQEKGDAATVLKHSTDHSVFATETHLVAVHDDKERHDKVLFAVRCFGILFEFQAGTKQLQTVHK